MLATSLVFSRGLFGVAAWRGRDRQVERVLEAQYVRVLRRVAGCVRYSAGVADDDYVHWVVGHALSLIHISEPTRR
eukprot:750778-Lingulodinium_polyedra.AAC.1